MAKILPENLKSPVPMSPALRAEYQQVFEEEARNLEAHIERVETRAEAAGAKIHDWDVLWCAVNNRRLKATACL